MNICIINIDNNPDFIGGIKRVSVILGKEWEQFGNKVVFVSFCTSDLKCVNIQGIPQYFLPNDKKLDCVENYKFLVEFIEEKRIDILLNQFYDDRRMTSLCERIRQNSSVKLVSVLHFSPTHRRDITRFSFFIHYQLGSIVKHYCLDILLFLKFVLYGNTCNERNEGLYFRKGYECSDLVVLLSEKFIPKYIRKARLKKTDKLIAINNPSVLHCSDDNTFKQNVKEKMVVWCGRLGYDMKRVDKMFSIWKKVSVSHPDWQLKVLGSGNVVYFKKLIAKFDIRNVEIVGFCNPYDYYSRAAIICMTSVTEGWGMVLVEGQSCGCVPIAFNSYDSLSDIITNGENGFVVKAFNEKEYVRKLSALMDDCLLRERMAANGLKSIERFDAQKIANKWIKEFEKLI